MLPEATHVLPLCLVPVCVDELAVYPHLVYLAQCHRVAEESAGSSGESSLRCVQLDLLVKIGFSQCPSMCQHYTVSLFVTIREIYNSHSWSNCAFISLNRSYIGRSPTAISSSASLALMSCAISNPVSNNPESKACPSGTLDPPGPRNLPSTRLLKSALPRGNLRVDLP